MEKISHTLRCGDKIIDVSSPLVMSILNVTPDSFYGPSRIELKSGALIDVAGKMLEDGAGILDIGGMSSRPGAVEIEPAEELDRVIPAIESIRQAYPDAIISVDTYRSEVGRAAITAGAGMINDISGGSLDPSMIDVITDHPVAYVLMHMRGTPATMQSDTHYNDLISEIVKYFVNKLRTLHHRGIRDIIIDPGFGFSKTMDQNFQLIDQLGVFRFLECPVMIGLSRKSSLSQAIGRPVEETLYATTALHMVALEQGATILRVHDVKPAVDAIAIYSKLQRDKKH